jgi:rhodanese-related sulfurtransferase
VGCFVVVALVGYTAWWWSRQRKFAATLDSARITVADTHKLLRSDLPVNVLDVRSASKRLIEPFTLPGATFGDELDVSAIVRRCDPEKPIIIYCSCQNEVSAALVAFALRKAGFQKPLPLTGGIDAWRAKGYAVERITGADRFSPVGAVSLACPWPMKFCEPAAQAAKQISFEASAGTTPGRDSTSSEYRQ